MTYIYIYMYIYIYIFVPDGIIRIIQARLETLTLVLLTSLGIKGAQLRALFKPLNRIVLRCTGGFRGP